MLNTILAAVVIVGAATVGPAMLWFPFFFLIQLPGWLFRKLFRNSRRSVPCMRD